MRNSRYVALLGTSFIFVMFILLQLFQYHLKVFLSLSFSKSLFGFGFFIFASCGIGIMASLLYGWLRKKRKTAGVLTLCIFLLIEIAAVWLFFSLAASELNIPASWTLLLVSLYIPASGAAGFLSIALAKLADVKMTDAKTAAVLKPLSVAFSAGSFIAAAAIAAYIWLAA